MSTFTKVFVYNIVLILVGVIILPHFFGACSVDRLEDELAGKKAQLSMYDRVAQASLHANYTQARADLAGEIAVLESKIARTKK